MRKLVVGWLVVVVGLLSVEISEAASEETQGRSEYRGVVVEEVGKGSALEKAGLQPDDVLYSWTRLASPPANPEAASGEIIDFFDWLDFVIEQAPRGPVVLVTERGGELIEFRVETGLWEAEVRPVLPVVLEGIYSKGKYYLALGDLQAAVREWRSLAEGPGFEDAGNLRVWILLRIGRALGEESDWEQALKSFREALEGAESVVSQIVSWEALGKAHSSRSEVEAAEDAFISALEIRQKLHAESLRVSSILSNLAEIAWVRGRLDHAQGYTLQALRIQEKLAPQSLAVSNSLNSLGTLAGVRGELDRAQEYHLRALLIQEELAPESPAVAISLNELGGVAKSRGELGRAQDYYLRTLKIYDKFAPESLGVATSLNNLGSVANSRGELGRAQDYYLRALKIYGKLAPKSRLVATSLNNLGSVAWKRGELDHAQDYYLRSLKIDEQLASQSLDVASSLNGLANIAHDRGNLDLAEDYRRQVLRIVEKHAPKSLSLATSLNNLGAVAMARGELDRAFDYYFQALEIEEKLAPKSLSLAASLISLGSVARYRGEMNRAHDYYYRALKLQEKLAPESPTVALVLNNMGSVAMARGDLDRAHEYFSRALRIREQLIPESLAVATSLNNLGAVARSREELTQASDYLHRSLKIREQLAPQGLAVANSLYNLGALARERGESRRAQDYFLRSLQIIEQLAPQSLVAARSLNNLGDLARDHGEVSKALEYYRRALEVLDRQISKLGGSYNVQASFRAQYASYYHDTLELLLSHGRFEEAFNVSECFRAQTFLRMLAERDTIFTADIPEKLDQERRQVAVQYNRNLKRTRRLSMRDDKEELERVRGELEKLDGEAGDIEARIRFASPRLAALRYPRPLDVAGARQAIDPGTLLLSFSVGDESTALFALSHTEGLQVKILPLSEEELRFQVKRLRNFVGEISSGFSLSEDRLPLFQDESRALYDVLLGPVDGRIAASKRLLILPDGPLHALPFSALVRGGVADKASLQYLVEWRPVHVALSATVYAELKERRRSSSGLNATEYPIKLIAFGDAKYQEDLTVEEGNSVAQEHSTAAVVTELVATTEKDFVATAAADAFRGDAIVRSASRRGIFGWPPLLYSRHEVEGIASLYPKGEVRTFLGPKAVENRIKSLDPKLRILHLAAHVHTDEHLPMSSFVALTIPEAPGPEQDNGLLQVWEIFEDVRIDADLVVLSACESGLGQELGSEGLIGLTRAFQYAGARSVVASLWSVADRTTAELMIRFYRHLRAGLPKDEALRAAQLEFIRGPIEVPGADGEKVLMDASAPFYWAAFQIFGDWQ